MYAIVQLQRHGLKWFIRRVVRELIRPTTHWGHYFKPVSSMFYYLFSKPVNYIHTSISKNDIAREALYFFYDFEIEPITYDFVWALCVANAKREELGLSFLTVIFVPGTVDGLRQELPAYEQIIDHDARIWRIEAILLPSVKLLSCKHSIIVCATRAEARKFYKEARFVYPTQYNVTFPVPYEPEQAVAYRQKCMSLRADKKAKEYVSAWLRQHAENKKVVVVTLRQYKATPERNSKIEAWARFAHKIDNEQYFIVFVPDTEEALNDVSHELNSFAFFHAASWNLSLRSALYELAYLNLGVNTGPMSLCWFNSRCRYITFKTAIENVPQMPLQMLTQRGFIPGINPAFAGKLQKWVWEEDNFDVILREFTLMCNNIINEEEASR